MLNASVLTLAGAVDVGGKICEIHNVTSVANTLAEIITMCVIPHFHKGFRGIARSGVRFEWIGSTVIRLQSKILTRVNFTIYV